MADNKVEHLGVTIEEKNISAKCEGGERDMWALRQTGTDNRMVCAQHPTTKEIFIMAFKSEEDAVRFALENGIKNAEPIFKKKETRQ